MMATILDTAPLGPQGALLHLDAPTEGYTAVGQYCKITVEGHTGYFVMAAAPGPDQLAFYVQAGGAAADVLLTLKAGDQIEISEPQGEGFGLDEALAGDEPLMVASTGSGFSAVRGILQQAEAAGRAVDVLVGYREAGDVLFPAALDRWGALPGWRVRVVLSEPAAGWTGLTGYVQAHVGDDAPQAGWVFLCGQRQMQDEIREACVAAGLSAARVRTNY